MYTLLKNKTMDLISLVSSHSLIGKQTVFQAKVVCLVTSGQEKMPYTRCFTQLDALSSSEIRVEWKNSL